MVAKRSDAGNNKRRPPATTPEARDNQLISLAYDLAEQKLLDGTASDGLTTHWLKMGAAEAKLQHEKMRNENLLAQAKVAQIEKDSDRGEFYQEVLDALRGYQGLSPIEGRDDRI